MERTRWWLSKPIRYIPFDEVERVDSDYSSHGTSWSWFQATDSVESYKITLSLKGVGEIIDVCSFRGEGAVMTGMHGVVWGGDDVVDHYGDQGDLAEAFVSRIEEMLHPQLPTQARSSEPTRSEPAQASEAPVRVGSTARWSCAACGQGAPPEQQQCLYCGGQVEAR